MRTNKIQLQQSTVLVATAAALHLSSQILLVFTPNMICILCDFDPVGPYHDLQHHFKINDILKYQGKQAGQRRHRVGNTASYQNQIPVIIGWSKKLIKECGVWRSTSLPKTNLARTLKWQPVFIHSTQMLIYQHQLPVKVKKCVKATRTLEVNMQTTDIDLCVVTKTYLKHEMPDALVQIPGYSIYRRDRNQFGNDLQKKGSMAVYIRNNLCVLNVSWSNAFELISITLDLPSSHKMLLCS